MLGILKRMAKFEKRINAIWSEIFCNKNNVSIHHILTAKKIAVIFKKKFITKYMKATNLFDKEKTQTIIAL